MKIGVMSDTHGHLDTMRQVAKKMTGEHHVDAIVHLGDDSNDAKELAGLSVEFYGVPGIFEARYKDPSIPNRLIHEFEDVPFLITHTSTKDPHDIAGDIDPAEAIADGDIKVVLHGHSHKWRIAEERNVIIVNPGHLKGIDDRGLPPTYAILDVTPAKLDVKIFALSGEVVSEKLFFLEG